MRAGVMGIDVQSRLVFPDRLRHPVLLQIDVSQIGPGFRQHRIDGDGSLEGQQGGLRIADIAVAVPKIVEEAAQGLNLVQILHINVIVALGYLELFNVVLVGSRTAIARCLDIELSLSVVVSDEEMSRHDDAIHR